VMVKKKSFKRSPLFSLVFATKTTAYNQSLGVGRNGHLGMGQANGFFHYKNANISLIQTYFYHYHWE
jgi:hypothetical protein